MPLELSDKRAVDVLVAATDRAAGRVRLGDILYAVVASGDQSVLSVFIQTLEDGADPRHLLNGIDLFAPAGNEIFEGSRDQFTPDALAALDEFDAADATDAALELLTACALEHLDPRTRGYLRILDVDRAASMLRERVRVEAEKLPPLVDALSRRLRSEEFTADAWACLERAGEEAARLGYDRILPPHVFLALLAETEGLTEHLVRLQAPPQVGPAKVAETVTGAFRLSDRMRDPLPLERDALGQPLTAMLERAQRSAAIWGAERVDNPHLLNALLDDPPPRLVSVLQAEPLAINVARMRAHLEQALRDARSAPQREVAFRLPAGVASSEDLTWLVRTRPAPPAVSLDRYFEPLGRALHRRSANHVLVTAPSGVGSTTLLIELARRAAAGQIPFLRRKRFLHVECGDIPPDRSGEVLAQVIAQVAGRTDLIVCLDGLGALLRGKDGADHRLLLRSALRERRIHLIGVLTAHDYDDLLTGDHSLLELTTRIEMVEPDQATARAMVRQAADGLAEEFGVSVSDLAVERSVVHSADYIPNERLPRKAIKVLRRACEDLNYRRKELGAEQDSVGPDEVASVIAEISGVPESQISGVGGKRVDYEQSLATAVVGQPEAVRVVASELRRIKVGLSGAGRPASVMLFAGLTGVGKTELAKTVARFYSASKRLQTYPMENYTESHSVSGIIGSPPGYIGHDQGGRLVNDLNADPYCVFLLDEAEKAHPEVWRPFLNLFDEGWITDQRGVKAFGDRAIFILTSNAGHDIITQMSDEGRSADEILTAVRNHLRRLKHERSNQLVFPPEFLGRIRQIIVFRPLDRDAMRGICRIRLDEQRRWWKDRRGKELVIPDELVENIALWSYADYQTSGGADGGRLVGKMISKFIEDPLISAAEAREEEFRRCSRVELVVRRPPGYASAIDVVFHYGPDAP